MAEEEYFNTVNQPGTVECNESCQKTMKDYFNMDMQKFKVPDSHLFVMGDTGWSLYIRWFTSIF
jgi:signal peptidase I